MRHILEKISVFENVEQGKIEQLIDKFNDQTGTFSLPYHAAPYYLIEDYIYRECLKKDDHKEKNNFIDRTHAGSALSYCDYFITDDGELERFCQGIINNLNLLKLLTRKSQIHDCIGTVVNRLKGHLL